MDTTRQRRFREDGGDWWKGPVRPLVRVADLVSALQAAGDLAAVVLAYALASRLWPILTDFPAMAYLRETIPPGNYSINALVTACLLVPVFHSMGLY